MEVLREKLRFTFVTDSKDYSNKAWIQIYNTKLFGSFKYILNQLDFKILNTAKYTSITSIAETAGFITQCFNIPWEDIINLVHYLCSGTEGCKNYSEDFILFKTDYWFVMQLFDKFQKEVEEKQKQQEEQNKYEQAEYSKMQDLYQNTYGSMTSGNFNMSNIPDF